jgi:replicative DNA helicase
MAGRESPADDLFSDDYLRFFGGHLAEPVQVVATPFPTWTQACLEAGEGNGLAQGWFVTLGGNPGFGKTILSLNMAVGAVRQGFDVGYCSLEMSRHELASRVYRSAFGRDVVGDIGRSHSFDATKFRGLAEELGDFATRFSGRMFVNREPVTTIRGVMEFVRYLMDTHGVRVFFVDYLQLACQGGDDSIYKETVEIANSLRREAHAKRALVIGLSQFNRSTSSDFSRAPTAQGLHGGMILEASSDQVVLIDHSRWARDALQPHLARSWFLLDKNRHGPDVKGQGERDGIPFLYDFRRMQVREAMPDEGHMWPGRAGGRGKTADGSRG